MFLRKIVEERKRRIEEKMRRLSLSEIRERSEKSLPPRNLMEAFSRRDAIALFAEIKFASPSAGVIKTGGDPVPIAIAYESAGASAISVLTEPCYFKGELSHLTSVTKRTSVPVLQKDFIVDPFQIYEGRAAGADSVLLIAALLEKEELKDFVNLAQGLGMIPLVEIHDEDDLEKVWDLSLPLLGINNRNLKTLQVDLETTFRLRKKLPLETKVVSESGIRGIEDIRKIRSAGADAVLIGEVLMRSADPAAAIRGLLQG